MKKVRILNSSEGLTFGFPGRDVTLNAQMSLADAAHIQALYPGLYCEVIDAPAATPVDDKTKSAKAA